MISRRLALVLLPAWAAAGPEVPMQVTLQGRLLDATDALVDGPVQLTVSLWSDAFHPEETYRVWSDTFVTTAHRGLLSVTLGAGTNALTATDLAGPRFLGVAVNGGPELEPRLAVTSAPYALYAARAAAADEATHAATAGESTHAATAGDASTLASKDVAWLTNAANLTGTVGGGVVWHGEPIADLYVAGATAWSGKLDAVEVKPPLGGDGTSGNGIALAAADGDTDGYLKAQDWLAFSGKLSGVSAGAGLENEGLSTLKVKFGNTEGTAAEGNDSRLADARAPLAGSPDYIQNLTSGPQTASFNITGTGALAGLVLNPGPEPVSPVEGQIYYDAAGHMLRLFDGVQWLKLSAGGIFVDVTQLYSSWTHTGAGAPIASNARLFTSGGQKKFAVSTESASSGNGSGARLFDGDNSSSSYWRAQGSDWGIAQCIEFWFPTPAIIKTVRVNNYPQADYYLSDYALERWGGSSWQSQVSYSGSNVDKPLITNTALTQDKAANSWRIYFPPNASNTDVVHITELTEFVALEAQ